MHFFEQKVCSANDNWYVILVRNGRETLIKRQLLKKQNELQLKELLIPEPIIEDKDGKLGEASDRYKFYLGYVFIKVTMSIEKYRELLLLESVYRFLGNVFVYDKQQYYVPSKVPENEIENLKKFLTATKEETRKSLNFQIGDDVVITAGDLASLRGKITSISNNYVMLNSNFFGQIKVPYEKVAIAS